MGQYDCKAKKHSQNSIAMIFMMMTIYTHSLDFCNILQN